MGDVDTATKVILQSAPDALLRAAFGADVRDVRRRDPVRASALRVRDGLFDASIDGREALAHLEVELNSRGRITGRVKDYWHELSFALRRPVSIAVVYLERGRWRRAVPSAFLVTLTDGRVVASRFPTLCLWELDAERMVERGDPGLLPLVPFMRGRTPRLVSRALARLRRAPVAAKDRAELQVATSIFAGRVFPLVDWLGTLTEEERMRSPTFAKWVKEKADEDASPWLRAQVASLTRRIHGRVPRGLRGVVEHIHDAEALRALVERVQEVETADEVLTAARAAAKANGRKAR